MLSCMLHAELYVAFMQLLIERLLRHVGSGGKGAPLNGRVICTQPRRISATSVAERVAAEQNCAVGESVGYQVGRNPAPFKPTMLCQRTTQCSAAVLQIQRLKTVRLCTARPPHGPERHCERHVRRLPPGLCRACATRRWTAGSGCDGALAACAVQCAALYSNGQVRFEHRVSAATVLLCASAHARQRLRLQQKATPPGTGAAVATGSGCLGAQYTPPGNLQ